MNWIRNKIKQFRCKHEKRLIPSNRGRFCLYCPKCDKFN